MNTVDALNVLGKALCGDSFEVKPGLTDAETILEIAKNYEGGSGSDSGGGRVINLDELPSAGSNRWQYETGLNAEDFAGGYIIANDTWNVLTGLAYDSEINIVFMCAVGPSNDDSVSLDEYRYYTETGIINLIAGHA